MKTGSTRQRLAAGWSGDAEGTQMRLEQEQLDSRITDGSLQSRTSNETHLRPMFLGARKSPGRRLEYPEGSN